jgi:hypothetical protein
MFELANAPLLCSAGCSPLAARSGELTGRSIFDVLGSFLEQESGKLKRLNRNPLVALQLGGEVLELAEGLGGEGHQPTLGPRWIGRSTTPCRSSKPGLNFSGELHGAKMASASRHRTATLGAEPFGDLVHVELRFHFWSSS